MNQDDAQRFCLAVALVALFAYLLVIEDNPADQLLSRCPDANMSQRPGSSLEE